MNKHQQSAGTAVTTAERTLVSIAMLKVKYDRNNQDYLDYLRPYVLQVLPEPGAQLVSQGIADKLISEFGLKVPIQVVERLLSRISKSKAIIKQNGFFYVQSNSRDDQFEQKRIEAKGEISEVILKFKQHCQERFNLELSDEEAMVSLVGFIRSFAVDCLRSFLHATPIPEVPSSRKTDVWAASFVNSAADELGSTWKRVKTLFQSVFLANAFTCPDSELSTAKFKDVVFYFDTPMVLSVLGLHGLYEQNKCNELIKQIRELGRNCASPRRDGSDEVVSVLQFAENHLDDDRFQNRVLRYINEAAKTKSDIAIIRGSVPQLLKHERISVRETPQYDPRYQINETELEGCLDQDIGHMNPKALLHDINAIRSIYVLRSGISPSRLEQAKAVFVTPNHRLARAADNYSKQFEMTREISPVITDFSLANICWLKKPESADTLISFEILATSFAALSLRNPNGAHVSKECEKLRKEGKITEDQLVLVRDGH